MDRPETAHVTTKMLAGAFVSTFLVAGAWAQETVFADAHTLLIQAIRAGQASGVLTGAIDEHFTRQFHSTGALQVKARVVKDLARRDCKRLEVVYTKEDVDTPKGKTQAVLTTELDYCLDGGPPLAQGGTG